MPEFPVVLLKFLVLMEPPLTAAALIAFLRSRPQRLLLPMRTYLAARLALVTLEVCLLWAGLIFPASSAYCEQGYFYGWIAGVLVILFLLYRTAAAVLAGLLQDLPGLGDLAKLLYRWLVVSALLMMTPSAGLLARAIIRHAVLMLPMMHFLRAYSLAELLPLTFTVVIAAKRRLSMNARLFGILAGLCLEPLFDLIRSWFVDRYFWGWSNFWSQVVTDGVLVLWLVYFVRRERPARLAPASVNMMHWDQIARRTLKLRSAAVPFGGLVPIPDRAVEADRPLPVASERLWATSEAAGKRG